MRDAVIEWALALGVALCFVAAVCGQTTFYVDSAAAPPGFGTSASPFATLEAVTQAMDPNVDQIFLFRAGSSWTRTTPFVIQNRTTIRKLGAGANPTIEGAGSASIGIRLINPVSILIEDVIVRRFANNWRTDGFALDVTLRRCEGIEAWDTNNFSHESSTNAGGTVVYDRCRAIAAANDGMSNRGEANDVANGCEITHSGPIWDHYELHRDGAAVAVRTSRGERTVFSGNYPTITRHLYVSSTAGNDANDGLTPITALATLTALEAALAQGDHVHFARGSFWTSGTVNAHSDNVFSSYGTGQRPKIQGAFVVAGVNRVWFEDLWFWEPAVAITVTGVVGNLWIAECLFEFIDTAAILCNDAAGSGTVNIWRCGFSRNDIADVAGALGDYQINAAWCESTRGGENANGTTAVSFSVDDDCNLAAYWVWIHDPANACFKLNSDTGDNILDGCWAGAPDGDTGVTVLKGVEIAPGAYTAGTSYLRNCTIAIDNPGVGETAYGLYMLAGTAVVQNCTFHLGRTTGGDGSSAIIMDDAATALTVTGCLFEARTTSAGTYYVTLDADDANFAFSYNWYHDAGAAASVWRDDGATAADMSFATWGAIATVTDDTTGDYVEEDWAYTFPAILKPWDARPNVAPVTILYKAANLYEAETVTWNHDAGLRERGINSEATAGLGWVPGAWECKNGSADGLTTHPDSGFAIHNCDILYNLDGIHFTHTHTTTDLDCIVKGNTIAYTWDSAIALYNGTAPFPIIGNVFRGNRGRVIDIDLSTATTMVIDGNVFVDSGSQYCVLLGRSGAGTPTYEFRNNIVIQAEAHWWPAPTDTATYGVYTEANATTNLSNNAFVVPILDTSTTNSWAVAGATSSLLNLYNNAFFGTDTQYVFYVRYDADAVVAAADHNFYQLVTTNNSRWFTAGAAQAFSVWEALDGGTADADGWHAATRIMATVPTGDPRFFSASDYSVFPHVAQFDGGEDLSTVFRTDFVGRVRPNGVAWSIGPFGNGSTAQGIFRSGERLVLSAFAPTAVLSDNLRLTETSVRGTTLQVQVLEVMLTYTGTATPWVIHEDLRVADRPIASAIMATTGSPIAFTDLAGAAGQDVYLSLPGVTSGTVSGYVTVRIVDTEAASEDAVAVTTPERAGVR